MIIPSLSEATLRQHSSEQSFSRGQQYYREGTVVSLVRRGNELLAEVEGSEFTPYRVRIVYDEGGITRAECDCPYDWGGWCKHIVAALLACIEEPASIEERASLGQLLADLSRDQLQNLLLKLAENDPGLADRIEQELTVLQAADTHRSEFTHRTPVDPKPFRRKVQAAIHSLDRIRPSEAYYQLGSVVNEIRSLLDQAQEFIAASDGRNALAILEAITDEYVEEWETLDDSDGEVSDFFYDLGPLWTEALLSADLTAAEREEWVEKLSEWQEALAGYDMGETFDPAITAAEMGWDDPSLQRILKGEVVPEPTALEEGDAYEADLATAYLNVLERQGQYQEYLHLAKASGQMSAYVLMLVRLERLEEAVDEGMRSLSEAQDAFHLAQALRDHGKPTLALQVAEHGLTLEGRKGELAAWLCECAAGLGETERALRAAAVAFKEVPSLNAYLKVKELAGEDWPTQQKELLEHLRRTDLYLSTADKVDIFLHEKLLDDAISAVEKYAYYDTLARVMDAVMDYRPEWVVDNARKQAEEIIDAGKADRYDKAVEWLKKVRAAYKAAGREETWRDYLEEIRTVHGRKYKLMGLMKGL